MLHELYSSSNIIMMIKSRRMRYTVHIALMGKLKLMYENLIRKPEYTRPLGRHRRLWQYNIKMDLSEIVCRVWTGFIWLRTETGNGTLRTR